jgi:transposase InsO family protein
VYKQPKDAQRKLAQREAIKHLVDSQRKLLPRLGTRKVHHQIKAELQHLHLKCGRDKLFTLMRHYGLLIRPRRRYVQTTMSRHWLRKWPNLLKDSVVSGPDEAWVSDITYLKTEQGNCYLNMVTDVFSRKIVGFAIGDTMETEAMIEALKMALKGRKDPKISTIHHSDRGLQYCSRDYALMAAENNVRLSMTQNGDPYENALAERMNRTIKEEFGMDRVLKTKVQAVALVQESIFLYNHYRPHLALEMKVPEQVYKTKKIPAT